MANPEHDPLGLIGQTIENKYRIVELAGEGGFSAVYKAEHLIWNEPVAIKFFSILEAAKSELREKLLSDFIQEGKLMSQLSSRSAAIVQARDIGKLEVSGGDWIPYMVLEWLSGKSLDVVLRDEMMQGLPARTIAEAHGLLEPAAVALDIAHQQGVAHRDLKPANIVIMGDARRPGATVKVLDFGIAKVMAEQAKLQEQLHLTGQQITAFTPHYGAPEQFSRNFGATGPWSDVYAMALMLVELLRGGMKALDGATFYELGLKSCDAAKRPTPGTLGVPVTPDVERVFATALALHPRDRYSRMSEFWSALHRAVYPGADTWKATTPPVPPNALTPVAAPSSLERAATEHSNPTEKPWPPFVPPTELQPADSFSQQRLDGSTVGNMALVPTSRRGTPMLLAGGALALLAVTAGSVWWFGERSSGAGTPSSTAPIASAPEQLEPSSAPSVEPSTETTGEPTAAASASASAVAVAPRPFGRPPSPKASSAPKASGNPFDPSTFGGR